MDDLKGKTIVITGASSGTGAAAARILHALGANVVPIGGSREKTEREAHDLGVPVRTINLLDLGDIRRCVESLRADLPRIDILALNAGGVVARHDRTRDGIEPNLQLNAIGPWLLLQGLADRIEGGRVLATSSRTHTTATVDPSHLDRTDGLSWHRVYARSKLVGGILLREFGRRHPEVDVGDFHPGLIASDMGRYMGLLGSVLKVVCRPLLGSPKDGARHLIHLATREQSLSGGYFCDDRPARGSPQLNDPALGAVLWSLAERLTDHG
jgi:NAD(P)-dependent dehydrogenase (short-subunit alcohol dehydrogenase family)